jgi:ABC-type branched-subunit amino acid transport system substrate-binding protein
VRTSGGTPADDAEAGARARPAGSVRRSARPCARRSVRRSTPRSRPGAGAGPLVATVVLGLVLVACGQKPGVHVDTGPLAQAGHTSERDAGGRDDVVEVEVEVPADGPLDDAEGAGEDAAPEPDAGADGEADASITRDGTSPAPVGGSASGERPGRGGSTSGAGTREPRGSDRTGVTAESITLAIHAPVTGAAPLPSTSFEKAGDLYWRWVTEAKGEKVLGRAKVEVIFGDDRFEPNTAVQVCRQLASRAFTLTGGGGTDQIQACGRFAGQARVPYFSVGVTEAGLEGNPWYFAASMTYKQQAPLLAQYVAKHYPGRMVGAIFMLTPNQDDAVAAWEAGRQREGLPYTETLRHPKGNTSWYSGYAKRLHEAGTEVIFLLTTPLDYIRFAQVAEDAGYGFQYVGVGVSKGLNDVLRSGCDQVDGGVFFSPFPALETVAELDPDFQRAADRFGTPDDDIAWALWGLAKLQHALLERYETVFGHDLTREDFRAVVESAGRIQTGVFPDVEYSPQDHFGGTAVHVLEADCGPKQYRDGGTFVTGF